MANNNTANHIPGLEILLLDEFSEWHHVKPLFESYNISFFPDISAKTPFLSGDDTVNYALSGNITELERLDNLLDYRDHCGHDLLTIAAYAGHLELVQFLHRKGLPLEPESPFGLTPLVAATTQQHFNIVTWLVSNGVIASASDSDGANLIHLAALEGNEEILSLLLQHGVLVDSVDDEGKTALMAACQRGHHLLVNVLLSYEADIKKTAKCGKSALHYAAVTGHHKCFSLLLDADRSIINHSNDQHCDILNVAAYHGSLEIVEILVLLGADVNATDKHGRTALMAASEAGHTDIANYLLNHNARVSLRSMNGISAFEIALSEGNIELAKSMVSRLDVDSKDCKGNTSLILASRYGKLTVVKLLLQTMTQKSLNDQNNFGITALLASCMCDDCDLTRYLLDNGADVEKKSKNGLNAYQIAFLSRSSDHSRMLEKHFSSSLQTLLDSMVVPACALDDTVMLKQLHQKGSDIKRACSFGIRPLMMASYHGNKEMAKYLIENNAVIDGRNRVGLSAIAYAIEGDHPEMVDYLIGHGATLNLRNSSGKTLCHIITQDRNIELLRKVAHLGMDINSIDHSNGLTPLMIASQNGWLDVVQELVELNCDTIKTCKKGHDASDYASLNDHTEVYQYLKKQKHVTQTHMCVAPTMALTPLFLSGSSPAFNACIAGNLETLKREHRKGFNINSFSKQGLNALHYASYHCHPIIVQWLIDQGAVVNSFGVSQVTPLMVACARGSDEIVMGLIEHKCLLNFRTSHGTTAVHYTITGKSDTLLRQLMTLGADMRITHVQDGTPFNLACLKGNIVAVKLMIGFDANVNEYDELGRTPLMAAARNGHVQVATLLIDNGADISMVCKEDKNALHYAAEKGQTEMYDFLKRMASEQGIETGFRIDEVENDSARTVEEAQRNANGGISRILENMNRVGDFSLDSVHTQFSENSSSSDDESELSHSNRQFWRMCNDGAELQVFRELLEDRNLDINAQNSDGETGLILAVKREHNIIARTLVQQNAQVNCRDKNGRTALIYAAAAGNLPLVILLVEDGRADLEIPDNQGNHVISVASETECDEVLMYLLEKRQALSAQIKDEFLEKCIEGDSQWVENAVKTPHLIPSEKWQTGFCFAAASCDIQLMNIFKLYDNGAYIVDILKQCIGQNNQDSIEFLINTYTALDMAELNPMAPVIVSDNHIIIGLKLFAKIPFFTCLKRFSQRILVQAFENAQYKLAHVASKWMSSIANGHLDHSNDSQIHDAISLSPLKLSSINNPNVYISEDKHMARRKDSFDNGICFGSSCPVLESKPGYWIKPVPEILLKRGNVLFFYITQNGECMFGLNNESEAVFIPRVNLQYRLYPMIDIYGQTVAVEIVDPASLSPTLTGMSETEPGGGQQLNRDSRHTNNSTPISQCGANTLGFYTPKNKESGDKCYEFQDIVIL